MSFNSCFIVTTLIKSIFELGKRSRRCPIKIFAFEPYFRMNSKTEKPPPKHIAFYRQYFKKMISPKMYIDAGSNVPEASKKAWKAKHTVSSKMRCQ
ncbi:hypothetical protein B9Z55_023194 [Caenorhabditis nigoni]|uniref:Uncharacterized protein n=1 Tax=Caenorhabditis nigoni TaxID=1611254 RepID=A0A2G5SP24_9PELO|nr:hypothetical protein B9Z55_023194 [Caenorhabditis nigoni]